jgi:uncharacterized protein (DUF2147 family)
MTFAIDTAQSHFCESAFWPLTFSPLNPSCMKAIFFRALFALVATASISGIAAAQSADAILGEWYTQDRDAKIKIEKLGDRYVGSLVWLQTPLNEEGKPKVDKKNPVVSLRTRPILGLRNVRDLQFAGDGKWENGKIYDPKTGNDYDCKAKLLADKRLEFRGYMGVSWIGKTTIWSR